MDIRNLHNAIIQVVLNRSQRWSKASSPDPEYSLEFYSVWREKLGSVCNPWID